MSQLSFEDNFYPFIKLFWFMESSFNSKHCRDYCSYLRISGLNAESALLKSEVNQLAESSEKLRMENAALEVLLT
jgi:hypothetical protein